MTFGAEQLVLPIIRPIIQTIIKCAPAKIRQKRLGIKEQDLDLAKRFNSVLISTSWSGLAVASSLPSGISVRDLQVAMDRPASQGAVREMVAAVFADSDENVHALAKRRLYLSLQGALSLKKVPLPSSIVESMYSDLRRTTTDIRTRLEAVDPAQFQHYRDSAYFERISQTLDSIGRSLSALEASEADLTDPFFLTWNVTYRKQLQAAHGFITPPDFDRKRKVPVDRIYVSPTFTPTESRSGRSDAMVSAVQLDELAQTIDRTVILGDPGGGKSTVSGVLAYRAAKSETGPLPFVVVLRDWSRSNREDQGLVDYLEDRLRSFYQCPPPKGAVEAALLSGEAIVILDGLDELLDSADRRDLTDRIELFAVRYPLTKVLVTSRLVGYDQAALDPKTFGSLVLSGFDADGTEEYVRKWFAHVDELNTSEIDRIAKNFMIESREIADIRGNPLMLALICIIYRGQGFIPRNRPEVYEQCTKLLYDKWDSNRQIHVELQARAYLDSALKHIALWIVVEKSGEDGVSERELVDEIANFLTRGFRTIEEARSAATEFLEFCSGRAWVFTDAGLTANHEKLFKFTHRTFMEYFAAFQLVRKFDGPRTLGRELLPRVAHDEWDTIGQLAVQISDRASVDGADRVLNYLLGDKRRRSPVTEASLLGFTARCLRFAPVTLATVRATTQRILANSLKLNRPIRWNQNIRLLILVREEATVTVQDCLAQHIRELLVSGSKGDVESAQELFGALAEATRSQWSRSSPWSIWLKTFLQSDLGNLVPLDAEVLDGRAYEVLYQAVLLESFEFSNFVRLCSGPSPLSLDVVFGYRWTSGGYRSSQPLPLVWLFLMWLSRGATDEWFATLAAEMASQANDLIHPPFIRGGLPVTVSFSPRLEGPEELPMGLRWTALLYCSIIVESELVERNSGNFDTQNGVPSVKFEFGDWRIPRMFHRLLRQYVEGHSDESSEDLVSELDLGDEQGALMLRWLNHEVHFIEA